MIYSRIIINRLKKLFTIEGYAIAPVWYQLIVLFFSCALIIGLFSIYWNSISASYLYFIDPPAFSNVQNIKDLCISLIQLIIGFICTGFIISILTSTLGQLLSDIKSGKRPYRGKRHLIIINRSNKIFHILREINDKFKEIKKCIDIVILLKSRKEVDDLLSALDIEAYSYLNVYVKYSVLLRQESYQRISIIDALGVIVLIDKDIENKFHADNQNLKILSTMLYNEDYKKRLVKLSKQLTPQKCVIELNGSIKAEDIVHSRSKIDGCSMFTAISPTKVIDKILSRSIIDILYYQIYQQLFSFTGHEFYFVNPNVFKKDAIDMWGRRFEDLHLKFYKGTLLGYSRFNSNNGEIDILLNPFSEGLSKGDWLIFLAENENSIQYDKNIPNFNSNAYEFNIPQVSEISKRRICMIGNYHEFKSTKAFLDYESQENIRYIQKGKNDDYFDEVLLQDIISEKYDHVIINLEDEYAIRLTLFLINMAEENHPDFIRQMITILENPINDDILKSNLIEKNVILSEYISASMITQIAFQKNLNKVFYELLIPEGNDINFLETESTKLSAIQNKDSLKRYLLLNKMSYIGTITKNLSAGKASVIEFDAENVSTAEKIIILSKGDC